jgi:16S rRNA (cytidine1402-2'-O)-methyltransferase
MLYIVPTPIGNLDDITLRALRVLEETHLIACEDTRRTGKLLAHFDIDTPTTSYHDHNEREMAPRLVERMQAGQDVALVSDAGTPGISDPCFYLARECHRAGVAVEALPGPTAFVPALVASALPSHRFVFEGFLPQKKGRAKRLKRLAEEKRTIVFYESPHRVKRALREFKDTFGPERMAFAARELTKKFAEQRRGTLAELHEHFTGENKTRGEFVLIVAGKDAL